jgi:VCBS repeat-containing protein
VQRFEQQQFITIMAVTRVFIDSRVKDKELLISQFAPGTEYQVLDANRDGIEQLVTALSGQSGYDSIQIISHGAPGSITIGSTVLNNSSLDFYAAELALLGNALTENGDLLLYGCNVAAGDQGQHFIETLSQMTGADVAASDDPTGGTAAGGNWALEVQTGAVDQTATVDALNYGYLLSNSIPTVSGPLAITVVEGNPSISLNLLANAHDVDLTDTPYVGIVSYTVNGVPTALPAGITMNGNTLTINLGNPAYNGTAQGEQKTIVASYQVLDSSAASASFATKVDYATGDSPLSVASADVDNDGKFDLIVANFWSDTVSVLKNNGDGTFADKVDYTTGFYSCPVSVTSADVNDDGNIDLIVANGVSGVSVLINNGDGTFASRADYLAGERPYSVTSADVNNDGKIDLIVANEVSYTVSVLKNNGDGTFAAKVDYATGKMPHSVTSADVNGDALSDLIVANFDSDTVSVLKNNGDGTFANRVDYSTGLYSFPESVTSADVNGDGKIDLIIANNSDTISVFKNNGDGTFITRVDYSVAGTHPSSVASADVNGDGMSDLIVANFDTDTVSVLKNNGDGTFTTKVDYTTGHWPTLVTSADVNGDGMSDLIVANYDSDTVSVLINNSTGFSGYQTTTATITINGINNDAPIVTNTAEAQHGSVTEAGYMVEGSVTASGTLTASDADVGATLTWSIVDTTPESTYGSIAINEVTGVWTYTLDNSKTETQALNGGETVTQSYTARVVDEFGACADQTIMVGIHGTNDLPIVTAPLAITVAEGDLSISLNLLANTHDADHTDLVSFGTVSYTVNGVPSALPVGIAMNGYAVTFDPANAAYNAMAQGEQKTIVATYQVIDSSGTAESFATKVDYATGYNPSSLTSADVNGDSKFDLIVANNDSNTVSVLKNNGDGTFAVRVDYTTGTSPRSVMSADVNGDGTSDMIVANIGSNTVSVLKNNGDGTFATRVDYATEAFPCSATGADVNGDSTFDLIVANWGGNTVSVLKNNGDGTFATRVDYATGTSPSSVTSADVNGDSKFDLIVANWGDNTVSVLKNNGDGTFATRVDYATGGAPYSVTTADVNGDGQSDLIIANYYSDTVSVLTNNGDGTFATEVDYATGYYPGSVTSADVNGDEKLDLIVANTNVANHNSDTVSVLKNNGDGTFAAKDDYATGDDPISVKSVDVNGDGKFDLIVANASSNTVSVLINNSIGFSGYPIATATITVNGTNDVPIVDAVDVTGAVTELVTPIGNLTDSGTISFTDVDLTDTHSVSAVTASAGALGTLIPTLTTDTTGSGLGGIVTWNYTVAASAVEYLAARAHKVESFTFDVLDNNGGSTECTVDVVITGTSDGGTFDLAGAVTFWKSGAAIAGVTSVLDSDGMTTDVDGLYQHLGMADGMYALTSAKASGIAESTAIKANDALAALKIAVGMNPNADGSAVSPYQYLAADVNHDGQIKAADALNILKMAVKLDTAPAKEWLFVPDSVGSESMTRTTVIWPDNPLSVTLDIDQELNLIGIVKGDVNGSWAA